MSRLAASIFVVTLAGCVDEPMSELAAALGADVGVVDSGLLERDLGEVSADGGPMHGGPDAGVFDVGVQTACEVAGLDPVARLHEGASWGHDVVRGANGYLAVVLQRSEAGLVHAFLHRLPDEGAAPPPEDLTLDLGSSVNVQSVVVAMEGEVLWVAYTQSRWLGGSDYEHTSWIMEVAGPPPYRAAKIADGFDGPRRIAPRADGGLDVFFGHRYVPEPGAARLVHLNEELEVRSEGMVRPHSSETRTSQFLPPDRYFEVRGERGAYRLWAGRLTAEAGGAVEQILGPDSRLNALHVGRPLTVEGDHILVPTWELEIDEAGERGWRTYVRQVTDDGVLATLWSTAEEAERPALAPVGSCGYVLGTGTGELRPTNPMTTTGDLRWLAPTADGRLQQAAHWADVLPSGGGGACHMGLILASGPRDALAVWKDGCGPRSVFSRRLRFDEL